MSFYDLSLGYADDPTFKWEGGDFLLRGNIPSIVINFGSVGGVSGCASARNLLESPKYGGRVLDWGASGAKLSKSQVIEFLTEFYADLERKRALDLVAPLSGDRMYLLFSWEQ